MSAVNSHFILSLIHHQKDGEFFMKPKDNTEEKRIEEIAKTFAEFLVLEVEKKFLEKLEKNKQNETEEK